MLLTTTDTLSRPYTEVALVHVQFAMPIMGGEGALSRAYRELDERAAKLGATAVIGVRLSTVSPGQYLLMGTAVRTG